MHGQSIFYPALATKVKWLLGSSDCRKKNVSTALSFAVSCNMHVCNVVCTPYMCRYMNI